MSKFQKTLAMLLEEKSQKLELISTGVNKLSAIYNGKAFSNYADLPLEARHAVTIALLDYPEPYNLLRQQFSPAEAEERLAWCLFGSFDSKADIDVSNGSASIELSAHCQQCQYAKPFCAQILPNLTRRQQEAFLLMRLGLSDKQIAHKMKITLRTLYKHTSNALQRLSDIVGHSINREYIVTKLMEAGV